MIDRAHHTAACLGLDDAIVRRLQARGYLLTFELSEAEIRERLYRGHRRYLLRRSTQSGAVAEPCAQRRLR
jgi:hypothetical protein